MMTELKRSFPLIPLVAEEDSSFLRSGSSSSQKDGSCVGNFLVDSVVNAVADKVSSNHELLTSNDVLEAIDRGGKDAVSFGSNPATYWVTWMLTLSSKVTYWAEGYFVV